MCVISRRSPSHPSLPEAEGVTGVKGGFRQGQGAGSHRGKGRVKG